MSKPASAKPLSAEQKQFLEDCREAFLDMCVAAGVTEEFFNSGDATEVCDQVIRWWHSQPEGDRPDYDAAANILGVAMGDLLLSAFPQLEWRFITDAFGTSLGLWCGQPEVIAAPLDSVLKALQEHPDGFMGELIEGVAATIDSTLKGEPLPEGDEDDGE